jgi:hypothetical protein
MLKKLSSPNMMGFTEYLAGRGPVLVFFDEVQALAEDRFDKYFGDSEFNRSLRGLRVICIIVHYMLCFA